jgi:6-phosphogluconolactonase
VTKIAARAGTAYAGRMHPMRLIPVIAVMLVVTAMNIFAGESLVYFGTYTSTNSRGIYLSKFDPATGQLSAPELAAETKNPTFLVVAPGGHFLYAGSEMTDDHGRLTGAVSAFALENKTGRLTFLNQENSGGDGSPCHLSLDATGKCLLVANYNTGSIAALPVQADGRLGAATAMIQHAGSSVNPTRQAGPHAHFICPSPDNRFALNCDLGLDQVFVYRLDAENARLTPNDPPFARVGPGSGPRHLVFSKDGNFVYVINEMSNTISAFHYDTENAKLTEAQTISTLPHDFSGANTGAEIALHPSGKFLYASNRGHNSIVLFDVDQKSGLLTLVTHQSTLGRMPRFFAIDPSGRWLFAENQGSGSVVLFAIDPVTGKLKPTRRTLFIGSPVCAVFADEN